MSKPKVIAATTALLLAAAPLAFADSSTVRPDTATPGTTIPGTVTPRTATQSAALATIPTGSIIQSDQLRASKLIGASVYDVQNRDIGNVKDLVLDRDGRIAAVVVDVGSFLGMGGKLVAVNLAQVKTDNNRLTLDLTKEQLQQASAYQLENPDTGAGSTVSPAQGGRLGTNAPAR